MEELHVHVTVTDNTKRVLMCLTCDVQLMEFTGMPHERRLAQSAIEIHTEGPNGMSKTHDIVTLRIGNRGGPVAMSQGLVTEGDSFN